MASSRARWTARWPPARADAGRAAFHAWHTGSGSDHRHGRGLRRPRSRRAPPVRGPRAADRADLGEPGLARTGSGAVDHASPGRRRAGAGSRPIRPERSWSRRLVGSRATGSMPRQHRRAELALLATPALRTALDVAVDPLAQQDVQLPVPASGRIAARSARDSRPVRATSSAPSDVSNCDRARDARACAWFGRTPSASARSQPARSWRRFSSMISRSPG